MEIRYFKKIDSTHKYLINALKSGEITPPVCIIADEQYDGVGSRGNRWIAKSGNLFLSFCVNLKQLPKDLPLQSASIYFTYILKECLKARDSKAWVKWPNDLYIEDKKIGGVITAKIKNNIICSVGLNIAAAPCGFGKLDISIPRDELVEIFIKKIKKSFSWKEVFSKYKIEFYKTKDFTFHFNDGSHLLKNAKLNEDGSIQLNGEKIYSFR